MDQCSPGVFTFSCLKVKQLVVLFHTNCGGIKALMEKDVFTEPEGFIDSWIQLPVPATKEVLESDAS